MLALVHIAVGHGKSVPPKRPSRRPLRRPAVAGLLGGLPREVDVEYKTTQEKLGNLAGMMQMTGYMFKNAAAQEAAAQLASKVTESGEMPPSEGPYGTRPSSRSACDIFFGSATSGRRAFRNAIVARLVPALRAFNPELVMLSTGFDALAEDVGNSRSGPKASILPGIDLSPDDFSGSRAKYKR